MEKKSKIRKFDWERFLITVMGTAIGVALTFVVNGRVARHNKEQAQRLTAIMVIHDIDNTINLLKDWKKEEEKQDDLLRFALEQRDRLEGLSSDTLNTILGYLKAINIDFRFDTSKEKIFNSDLDTWQNLGNMAFLDNVQDFYHARQSFQDGVNHSTMWTGPIPDEDYMQFVMGTGWVTEEEFAAALRPFLKEKLYETQVVYYINISGTRVTSLGQWIDHWTRMNNENKFLMGITDRELEDYVSSISKKGVPLTRSKLLGHWVFTTGDHTNEYDFQSNHSYSYVNDYSSSYFKGMNWSGRMKMTVSYRGKWAFEGDSLVLTPDYNTVEMTVDPSGMVAEENMQDSLDSWVKNYRESTLNYFKGMVDKGDKYTVKALMDSAKDKMEWTDSDGNVRYVKRKEE